MSSKNQPFALDKKEFGEVFHVAAALKLHEKSRVAIVGSYPPAQCFLSLFADPLRVFSISDQVYESAKTRYRKVSQATNDYCSRWSFRTAEELGAVALNAVSSKVRELEAFLNGRIGQDDSPAVLLWIRNQNFERERNSTKASVSQLAHMIAQEGMRVIIIGDRLNNWDPPPKIWLSFGKTRFLQASTLWPYSYLCLTY